MKRQWIFLIGALVITVATIVAYQSADQQDVTDFASCAAAGNPIMESYPEQCHHNGATYTNPDQQAPTPPPAN